MGPATDDRCFNIIHTFLIIMFFLGEITNNEHTITFTYTGGIQPYVTGGRLPAGDT